MGLFDWFRRKQEPEKSSTPAPSAPPPVPAKSSEPASDHELCKFMLGDHAEELAFQMRIAELRDAAKDDKLSTLLAKGGEMATVQLAEQFRSRGETVQVELPFVRLPEWHVRFRCVSRLEDLRPDFTDVIIGVEVQIDEVTEDPIVVHQLGVCLDSPGNFAKATANALDQWFHGVWPVLQDLIRVLRGSKPVSPPQEAVWNPTDEEAEEPVEPVLVFEGPVWVGLTDDQGRRVVADRLKEWLVYERALERHVMESVLLEPERPLFWVKAYLGRTPYGEVFGEVKLNNEDCPAGLRSLMNFLWPDEVFAGGAAFKVFFFILRKNFRPLWSEE